MKVGVYLYGLATMAFGILDLIWGQFDSSHQPIQSLGGHIPGLLFLVYLTGAWMIAAGLAIVWRRTARIGTAASAIIYLIFIVFWLPRFYAAVHTLGWRLDILAGLLFVIGQELFLIAPAVIIYFSIAPNEFVSQYKAAIAARWMLGLPPIFFGLDHLIGIRIFAGIVPHWLPFATAWTVVTGIAFILAGGAICLKVFDVLAARLLALMLLLFEFLVEIPPVFVRSHSEQAWGAAVYNLAAIGALWIFAAFVVSLQTDSQKTNHAEHRANARLTESLASGS
ncbi:hypothetical protein ACFPT7_19060 [Acidicapsa dinghuensis]|uniref:DoxX family protein n=1 Tax=Acidicapsa dinghuensis TaxID=2218256 RepID=A0ABW1EK99_9BACT|nr:hypothetical protein [Acidicapsa dinghuensis]